MTEEWIEDQWVEDEYETRRFLHKGWKVTSYSNSAGLYIFGPNGEDVDFDESRNEITVTHEAPYGGSVGVSVPVVILKIAFTYKR